MRKSGAAGAVPGSFDAVLAGGGRLLGVRSMTRHGISLAATAVFVALGTSSPAKADERMYLSLGSRTPAARIIESSGLGTAEARAVGKVQPDEARAVCEGFIIDAPRKVESCTRGLLSTHAAPVQASANCMTGLLRPTGGGELRYAGEWPDGEAVGIERSKWRGADGRVLGNYSASGAGEASAQWAALCGPGARPGQPTFAQEIRARTARRSNGSPRDAFRQFVSFDRRGGADELFAGKPTPAMTRHLSAELARNWVAAINHDEPVFDASPFTGKQGEGFSSYRITKVDESDDSTSARVEAMLETPLETGTRRRKQLYMFVNEDNRWKLNEINYDPDGRSSFIHNYLKEYLRRKSKSRSSASSARR